MAECPHCGDEVEDVVTHLVERVASLEQAVQERNEALQAVEQRLSELGPSEEYQEAVEQDQDFLDRFS